MPKEKYTAKIDGILAEVLKGASKSIADKDKLLVTAENTHFIKKVAFDVYRVENDPYEGLWLMEQADDGKNYLVRASDPQFEYKKSGEWEAITDYGQENITLSYKNVPIARFSSKDYGFTAEDASTFKSAILEKADSDEDFIKGVLSTQPESKRSAICTTFPELKKYI